MALPKRVVTVVDSQTQRRFLWHLFLRTPALWLVLIPMEIFVLSMAILATEKERLACLGLAVLFPLLVLGTGEWMIRHRCRLMGEVRQEFFFCEKGVEVRTASGIQEVSYDHLYEIHETKQAIYLMPTRQSGWILKKSDCSNQLLSVLQKQIKGDNY